MQSFWPHCSDEKLVSNESGTARSHIYACSIAPFKSIIISAATLGRLTFGLNRERFSSACSHSISNAATSRDSFVFRAVACIPKRSPPGCGAPPLSSPSATHLLVLIGASECAASRSFLPFLASPRQAHNCGIRIEPHPPRLIVLRCHKFQIELVLRSQEFKVTYNPGPLSCLTSVLMYL